MFQLPSEIKAHIYEFDPTYHNFFTQVLNEIDNLQSDNYFDITVEVDDFEYYEDDDYEPYYIDPYYM